MKCNVCGKEFGNGAYCQNCKADRIKALGNYSDGFDVHNAHGGYPNDASTAEVGNSMICYKCYEVIPKDSEYCPYCGGKLFVSCPKCGYRYSLQYPICSKCGTNREKYLEEQRRQEQRRQEEERRQEELKRQEEERIRLEKLRQEELRRQEEERKRQEQLRQEELKRQEEERIRLEKQRKEELKRQEECRFKEFVSSWLRNDAGILTLIIPKGTHTFYGIAHWSWISQILAKDCENYYKAIKRVEFPDSLREIGDYAFKDCSSLTEIDIPQQVTKINCGSFMGCSSLKRISLPDTQTNIGNSASESCPNWTSTDIPNSLFIIKGLTTIGRSAFEGCSNLTSIKIPDSVTRIEERAFKDCRKLSNINIPQSLTFIGEDAFSGCDSIRSIQNLSSCFTCFKKDCCKYPGIKYAIQRLILNSNDYQNALAIIIMLQNSYEKKNKHIKVSLVVLAGISLTMWICLEDEVNIFWIIICMCAFISMVCIIIRDLYNGFHNKKHTISRNELNRLISGRKDISNNTINAVSKFIDLYQDGDLDIKYYLYKIFYNMILKDVHIS